MPIGAAGFASAQLVPNATLNVYSGAPHGITDTHKEQLSADLLAFVEGDTDDAAETAAREAARVVNRCSARSNQYGSLRICSHATDAKYKVTVIPSSPSRNSS